MSERDERASHGDQVYTKSAEEEIADLRAENQRLRAALAHYADEGAWKKHMKYDTFARVYRTNRAHDGWEVAREALAGGTVLRLEPSTGLFVREPAT